MFLMINNFSNNFTEFKMFQLTIINYNNPE